MRQVPPTCRICRTASSSMIFSDSRGSRVGQRTVLYITHSWHTSHNSQRKITRINAHRKLTAYNLHRVRTRTCSSFSESRHDVANRSRMCADLTGDVATENAVAGGRPRWATAEVSGNFRTTLCCSAIMALWISIWLSRSSIVAQCCSSGGSIPRADVARLRPVPAQMWHGCAKSWGTDVGGVNAGASPILVPILLL